ncbi:hypothetical protein [Kineosporia sp. NBRC 101731]|uniref:hypothetical protein n=1 Tax=Kineosporia sp. NBRC 101731 TaxID=3032199 RepID=UPI0024A3C7A9|nr:hypothetical protein [Kineosporia sp. NBRC 101731]GLY29114.1 hypothetical protein Kisp02_24790 [Kineosporia sp. NBRC 101731]
MAEELGEGQTHEQKEEIFERLRGECRVLLSSNSDPAESYRFAYTILTQDLAAGRLGTTQVRADVND